MKKYFIPFFFLIVIILPVEASADFTCLVKSSCNSGEVNVLELSSTTNAHAGLPGSGYPYSVCCSGVSGLGNSCSGNSQILAKLSGSGLGNSHVRINSLPDYSPGENACISLPTNGIISIGYQLNNCNGFDTIIASMSKTDTNAHIGDADAYSNKICASASMPVNTSSGSYSNFSNPLDTNTSPIIVASLENITTPVPVKNINLFKRLFSINKSNNNITTEKVVANNLDVKDDISVYPNSIEKNIVEPTNENNLLLATAFFNLGNFLFENPYKSIIIVIFLILIFIFARKVFRKKQI